MFPMCNGPNLNTFPKTIYFQVPLLPPPPSANPQGTNLPTRLFTQRNTPIHMMIITNSASNTVQAPVGGLLIWGMKIFLPLGYMEKDLRFAVVPRISTAKDTTATATIVHLIVTATDVIPLNHHSTLIMILLLTHH